MKKYLIILLMAILFVTCGKNENSSKETYPLAKTGEFKIDSSLYTKEKIIEYPSSVKKNTESYTKKDLDNLDYNKEIRLGDIFFRIPERCEVFKKDVLYYVDFPFNSSYDILINFKNIDEDSDLIDLSKEIIKKEDLNDKVISKPIRNKFTNLDSAYFLTKDTEYTYTHFFIKSANSTIYFVIKEKGIKAGGKIMADILMTAYTSGEDPYEVRKSFDDYLDSLSIYATRKVDFSDLALKIPENFYLNQEGDGFKYFLAKDKNEVIAEIIIKECKINGDIYQAYSQNSGQILYPAQIVNMGKINKSKNILEGDVRIYLQNDTLTGKKYLIKTDDSYISLIVSGPLANESLVKSMAESINGTIR